jgi:hypothetical protein
MESMELVVIALTALVLVGVLVLVVGLARRAVAGRRIEERVRTEGELEPIVMLADADRRPRRPMAPRRAQRQAA